MSRQMVRYSFAFVIKRLTLRKSVELLREGTHKQDHQQVGKHEHSGKWVKLHQLVESDSRKNCKNLRLLSHLCCFSSREYVHYDSCLQNTSIEKTDKFFYRQHGHFRPAVSNIHVSTKSNTVVRGFRLRLCQWSFWSCFVQADRVFTKCVRCCVYSEPGSDSSGPFWSCGISLPLPTHRFKAVRLFHSRHVDHRDGRQLAIHC